MERDGELSTTTGTGSTRRPATLQARLCMVDVRDRKSSGSDGARQLYSMVAAGCRTLLRFSATFLLQCSTTPTTNETPQ